MGGKKGKKGKKGRKGKKGKKKDPLADVPDEIKNLDDQTLMRELEAARQRIQESKIRRNYIQNEKDMLKQFFDITKKEAQDIRSRIMGKETDMEKAENNHRAEVTVFRQKIKHLEYDHSNDLRKVEVDQIEALKEEKNYHTVEENTRKYQKIKLRERIRELELSNVGTVKYHVSDFEHKLQTLRNEYKAQLDNIEQRYKEKFAKLKEDLELRLKVEIHEVEERKNKHRNELIAGHEKAFSDIKKYYNHITSGNLKLIQSLKEEKAQLEKNNQENLELINELERDNKRIKGPLEKKRKQLEELKKKLSNYIFTKVSLQNAKKHKRVLIKKLDEVRQQKKDLESKYLRILRERDELFARFELTVDNVRQKSEYKNVYLENKLSQLEENLLRKEEILQEVLRNSGLDSRYVIDISKKIEESLEAKNTIFKNLTYSLAHATKAYNDAIRVYEAKLVEFGIPAEELGFQLLEGNGSTIPAGLVAA